MQINLENTNHSSAPAISNKIGKFTLNPLLSMSSIVSMAITAGVLLFSSTLVYASDISLEQQKANAKPIATIVYHDEESCGETVPDAEPTCSIDLGNTNEEVKNEVAESKAEELPVGPVVVPAATNEPEKMVEAETEAVAEKTSDAPKIDGEKIYQTSCLACHLSGVGNAPKVGDKKAWEPLIAEGIATMVDAVVKGKGIMPPNAGNPNLTPEEIKATVEWMIKQ